MRYDDYDDYDDLDQKSYQGTSITPRKRARPPERHFWTPNETRLLRSLVPTEGKADWRQIAKKMPGRNAKQISERWNNLDNPSIITGSLTPEEWDTVLELQAMHGNKWKLISQMLPGRTPLQIKNAWWGALRRNKNQMQDQSDDADYEQIRKKPRLIPKAMGIAESVQIADFFRLMREASMLVEEDMMPADLQDLEAQR